MADGLPAGLSFDERDREIGDGPPSRSRGPEGYTANHGTDERARGSGDGSMEGNGVNIRRSGRLAVLRRNPMSSGAVERYECYSNQSTARDVGDIPRLRHCTTGRRNSTGNVTQVNGDSPRINPPSHQRERGQGSRATQAQTAVEQTCSNEQRNDPSRSTPSSHSGNMSNVSQQQTTAAPRRRARRRAANVPKDDEHAPAFFNRKRMRQQIRNPEIQRKTPAHLKMSAININGRKKKSIKHPEHKLLDIQAGTPRTRARHQAVHDDALRDETRSNGSQLVWTVVFLEVHCTT
ncbi:hypothetical protein C8F04DRAFT_1198025 [Mycena alexandri]|uniref:Uncharacterized protein n=1 Tax=Mycena alexandri TaxID=1745969 RepID=A0AAD6S0U5_9AGAR|nr:hypothetical protein C8F04DRAFT_1198025 [Mycena alexandri]